MIDSLHGTVLTIGLDYGVIECGGVGYRFLATPRTLGQLTRGEDARVRTALVVKEDAMTLYGFSTDDDRTMFHKLQTVSGLGPKLAVACLSIFSAAEIAQYIANEDAKSLQTIPGVGKRMAERMVLELKDKLTGLFDEPGASATPAGAAPGVSAGEDSLVVEQVIEALIGLGFTDKAVRTVVEDVVAGGSAKDTSGVLRAALSQLGRA